MRRIKKKILTVLGALLLICSLPLTGHAAGAKQFSDVPSTKHFAEAVYELAERNIIGGYPDGTFKPGNSITRGQAAAIIAKMIGLDTKNVKNPGFKDVTTANGYYKAIAAMAGQQMISGYGDGRFGPNDAITRAQMASIIVKAFDLPRYSFSSYKSPFSDVTRGTGHDPNIMTIYRLGITTGTTPNTFSPNEFITRGQAAKLLKTAETAKSQIVTIRAKDFGWEQFKMFTSNESDSGLFQAVAGSDRWDSKTADKIHLVPLREGTGKLNVALVYSENADKKYYRKFYVRINEVNGVLKLTLERTEDVLDTPAVLDVNGKKPVQNISLSTMDGKLLSDNVPFKKCLSPGAIDCADQDETNPDGTYRNVRITMKEVGQYIATVRFTDGEEIRYGIEVTANNPSFEYRIRTLEEKTSATLDFGPVTQIGKHVLPQDSEQIAEVVREPGTNLFTATGKKEGAFQIRLPENNDPVLLGIGVYVQKIGTIVNTSIHKNIDTGM